MDVVWIKLNNNDGPRCDMFGTGGIISMVPKDDGTASTLLYNANVYVTTVDESIDEIMQLIGSARNGVKIGTQENSAY
jgi:hypothetical protein